MTWYLLFLIARIHCLTHCYNVVPRANDRHLRTKVKKNQQKKKNEEKSILASFKQQRDLEVALSPASLNLPQFPHPCNPHWVTPSCLQDWQGQFDLTFWEKTMECPSFSRKSLWLNDTITFRQIRMPHFHPEQKIGPPKYSNFYHCLLLD